MRKARERMAGVSAVLISDYGYGSATPEIAAGIRGRKRWARPATLDSRYRLHDYAHLGLTAATPNEAEIEAAHNVRIGGDASKLEDSARRTMARLNLSALVVTRGRHGMTVFERRRAPQPLDVYGSDQAVDVTGAGDTVIAAFTLALAAGATVLQAAQIANYAGGLVVMKRGTATVTREELIAAIRSDAAAKPSGREAMDTRNKILPLDRLAPKVSDHKSRGERIVLANGCFDVLHVGHAQVSRRCPARGRRARSRHQCGPERAALKGDGSPGSYRRCARPPRRRPCRGQLCGRIRRARCNRVCFPPCARTCTRKERTTQPIPYPSAKPPGLWAFASPSLAILNNIPRATSWRGSERPPMPESKTPGPAWARWRAPIGYPLAALCLWLARPTFRSILIGSAFIVLGLLIRAAAAGHLRKREALAHTGPYARTTKSSVSGQRVPCRRFCRGQLVRVGDGSSGSLLRHLLCPGHAA